MTTGAVWAFRPPANRVKVSPGAATAATERRAPTRGRPRLPDHRGVSGRGAAVVDQDSGQGPRKSFAQIVRDVAPHDATETDSAALWAGLEMIAEGDERTAMADWRHLTERGRGLIVPSQRSRTVEPPWDAGPPLPPGTNPWGGKTATVAEVSPCEPLERVQQVYDAAFPCLQRVAARLTDALRAGAVVMTWQPAPVGAPAQPVPVPEWRDMQVAVEACTLRVAVAPINGARPPQWLWRVSRRRPDGHRRGSYRFDFADSDAMGSAGLPCESPESESLGLSWRASNDALVKRIAPLVTGGHCSANDAAGRHQHEWKSRNGRKSGDAKSRQEMLGKALRLYLAQAGQGDLPAKST